MVIYLQNTAANAHISSEGALVIDVLALNSGLRGPVSKTDVAPPANSFAALRALLGKHALAANVDALLLLEGSLSLCVRHRCCLCAGTSENTREIKLRIWISNRRQELSGNLRYKLGPLSILIECIQFLKLYYSHIYAQSLV